MAIWLGEAIDTMYPAVMDWIHHPSQASKRAIFDAYDSLSLKPKAAYDADVESAFRREHGATVTVYRYKAREDMAGASVSPVKPRDSTAHKAFEIRPSDVLVHYGQEEMPLGGKAFGHEKEIILRPNARPMEVKLAGYSYDRRAAKSIELSHYGLEGMPEGKPTTLYHGSTKLFRRFDINTSRDELVNKFYGRGIFLSPYKWVAERYADANRNIGFDPSIIDDLKRKNPRAGWFLNLLYKGGDDVWLDAIKEAGFWKDDPGPGEAAVDHVGFQNYLGVDPNDLTPIAQYTVGSAVKPLGDDSALSLFSTATGAPSWLYDTLDEVGLNSKVYRPKVYTVTVKVRNTLVTASKSQARGARSKGYDSVVFYGSDLVGGVPEIAVFDPRNVRINKIEII